MTLKEKQEEFIELFYSLDTWTDKFEYLCELSQRPSSFTYPEELKTPEYKINGCQSRTYLHLSVENDILHVQGWSNAAIPAGIVAVLEDIFDGCSLQELKEITIDFHINTGLLEQLSAQRQVLLLEMIEKIKTFTMNFCSIL